MALVQITPPASEPITLAQAKQQIRVEHDNENDLVSSYISTARERIEHDTRRQLVSATYQLTLDCFPGDGIITLPVPPLQEVTSIKYFADGVETELDESIYTVHSKSTPGQIRLKIFQSWPTKDPDTQVTVEFVAGYTTVPHQLQHVVRLLVAHYYQHRGDDQEQVPKGIEDLISRFYWGDYQ